MIVDKPIANSGHQSRFLVKVIPSNILDIGGYRISVSVGNIAVYIQPIGSLFQGYKPPEPGFTGKEIFSAALICAESASYQLSFIVECIGQAIYTTNSGVHGVIRLIKIVEIGFPIGIHDRLPAGYQHTRSGIVALPVLFEYTCQLTLTGTIRAQVVPELAFLTGNIAGKLLDAGQCNAILIERPSAIFSDPSVLIIFLDAERVVELYNGIHEVCAIVVGVVLSIIIRIQPVLLLELLILSNRH